METIRNIKKVLFYGKEYIHCLIIQIIMCICGIAVNIILPIISAKFIIKFTSSSFKQAILISLVILGIYLFEEIKTLIIRKNTQIFRRGTVRNLQTALGRDVLRLEQRTIDDNSSGVFVQRIIGDTDKMASMFTSGMGILTGFISNIGSFIAVLIIDWHMFLYYLIGSIVLSILFYIKNEKTKKLDIEYRDQCDKVTGLTTELVRGSRDIKMLYSKDSFLRELDKNVVKQSEMNFKTRNTDIHFNIVIHSLKDIFLFGSVIILVLLIKYDYMEVATALILYNYKDIALHNLMNSVSQLLEECKNFNISSNRVFNIMNDIKFKKEKFGTVRLNEVSGEFEFENVEFSYDGINKVLDGLSFRMEPNKTYGIVGKSGCGKTTLFNLLCKLYEVDSGDIKIDGVNIRDLDEESIRGNITIISQNPYIFNMSIKDNMRLIRNDVTEEEIIQACKLSCLHEYIMKLPDGYDTVVGEGGVNLSGGQRQRLAIARALIQKTKIILFDEATSALDNETQNKIQEAINNLKKDYTVVIIAHRLSTIIGCDKICYMENGRFKKCGTHEELLAKCKNYKELYEYEIKTNK